MSELLKVTYLIDEHQYSRSNLIGFVFFLGDITNLEYIFLKWAKSDNANSTGTNFTHLEKWQNNLIRISFPEFYDDYENNENCMFMKKENFIQFLTDWQAFGKSGKKYMMLREEDGWISLEDIKDI